MISKSTKKKKTSRKPKNLTAAEIKVAMKELDLAKAEGRDFFIGLKKIRCYSDIYGFDEYMRRAELGRKQTKARINGFDVINSQRRKWAKVKKDAKDGFKQKEEAAEEKWIEQGAIASAMLERVLETPVSEDEEVLDILRENALDKENIIVLKKEEKPDKPLDYEVKKVEFEESEKGDSEKTLLRIKSICEEYEEILNRKDLTFEERRAYEVDMVMKYPDIFSVIFKASLVHFIAFFHRYMHYTEFKFKPHHLKITDALSKRVLATEKLEKPHLMINISPRAGKTQIIKYFSSWGYAHNPSSNFIVSACDEKLAQDISAEIKQIVSTECFKLLFGTGIDSRTQAKDFWKTDKNGAFRASPLRGGIVGYGAGVLSDKWGGCFIIDDTLKPVDANSKAVNEEVWDIYSNTIKSRRNNKSGNFQTPIILIAQRLSIIDLCARIEEIEIDQWEVIKVPALDKDGKSYWEEQISTEELLEMKRVNPFLFYAQYMQEPIAKGGMLIKSEWFKFFSYKDLPTFKKVFLCADTAFTTGKFSDFSAIGLMGVSMDNRLYFLDLLHLKAEQETLKQKITEFWEYHKKNKFWSGADLSCIVIEKRGGGISLIQDLRRQGAPVREIVSMKNKGQRAVECSSYWTNGYVMLPESEMHPISRVFLNEAVSFTEDAKSTATIHDDVLDMLMYAMDFGLMRKKGLF